MIQKITIDVEIPEGYEATGEYRYPLDCEPWLTAVHTVRSTPKNDVNGMQVKRIILRKPFTFPAWFKTGWWLQQDCGVWFATQCESYFSVQRMPATWLWDFHGETFVPPTVTKLQCVR